MSVDDLIAGYLGGPDRDDAWELVSELRHRGSRAVFDRAVDLCRSECATERSLGASILGQLGIPDRSFPSECVRALAAMLGAERHDEVVCSIFIALGHLHLPEVVRPAARFARHADPDVRYATVHALMGQDDALAIRTLIGLTGDSSAEVRDWSCFALGTQSDVDTPALRAALAGRLADDDAMTRSEAMLGLARRGDRRMVEPLRRELTDQPVAEIDLEAAAWIADPSLLPALLALRARWDDAAGLLGDAIVACGGSSGGPADLALDPGGHPVEFGVAEGPIPPA